MRYRAYGIDVESDFPIPSLQAAAGGERTALRLRAVADEEVEQRASGSEGRCVERIVHPDGDVGLRIDEHPTGYRMEVGRFGRYFLHADRFVVDCAPVDVEPWRRERFLVARILPIAALLAGYELLHASAVEIGGVAVAILGPSGAGKSSIALRLSLRGLPILTDDLLCVALTDGEVLAYPGTRLIGIRDVERRLLSDRECARLGEPVDRGDKHYGQAELAAAAIPLRLHYLLRRGRKEVGGIAFSAAGPPDPQLLLGSTFFAHLHLTEPRLLRQLDVYRSLAQQAELFTVEVSPGVTAAEVAEEIELHASARVGEALSA